MEFSWVKRVARAGMSCAGACRAWGIATSSRAWRVDLGLSGYARNLDDGGVEVYAAGTAEALNELSGYLWKGPRMSEVRGVEEQEAPVLKYWGFHIE